MSVSTLKLRRAGKRLTYFLFVLSMLLSNQSFCANVDDSNFYFKELIELKERNPKIKMEVENWGSMVKQQHQKIDLIPEMFYPENIYKSKSQKFSDFVNDAFLGVISYLKATSRPYAISVYCDDLPLIFNKIDQFSKKTSCWAQRVCIDFNRNSNNLVEIEEGLVYSHSTGNYNVYFNVILTKKCFEPFDNIEFDNSLASVFAKIKNSKTIDLIAVVFFLAVASELAGCYYSYKMRALNDININEKALAGIWAAVFLTEFYFLFKWIKKYYKDIDLDTMELLDDPKQYIDSILSFPPEELKKQYISVVDRIKDEIQEKYPERAK
ncbi:MAG: hypothetical protein ABIA74_06425, partial [bacterium]